MTLAHTLLFLHFRLEALKKFLPMKLQYARKMKMKKIFWIFLSCVQLLVGVVALCLPINKATSPAMDWPLLLLLQLPLLLAHGIFNSCTYLLELLSLRSLSHINSVQKNTPS
jgi:hypothetical protein